MTDTSPSYPFTKPVPERDHEKDALSIRSDLFKHASTLSTALVTVSSAFLFFGLKDLPSIRWPSLLIVGIFACLFAAISGFSGLSNMAYHVRKGEYGIPADAKKALVITQSLLLIGALSILLFFSINALGFSAQQKASISEDMKAYAKGYIDGVLSEKVKLETESMVALKVKEAQTEISRQIEKAFKKHNAEIKQYLKDTLKEYRTTKAD